MNEEILNIFYLELGARVKSLREKVGMKQEVLACSLGLTRASVINIEKGRHKPNLHTIIHIATLLDEQYTKLIPHGILAKSESPKLTIKDFENVITDQQNLDKKTLAAVKKTIANLNQ